MQIISATAGLHVSMGLMFSWYCILVSSMRIGGPSSKDPEAHRYPNLGSDFTKVNQFSRFVQQLSWLLRGLTKAHRCNWNCEFVSRRLAYKQIKRWNLWLVDIRIHSKEGLNSSFSDWAFFGFLVPQRVLGHLSGPKPVTLNKAMAL